MAKSNKQAPPAVNWGAIRQNLLTRDGALDGRYRTQKVRDRRREAGRRACRQKVEV
jgi:hypothetical protein